MVYVCVFPLMFLPSSISTSCLRPHPPLARTYQPLVQDIRNASIVFIITSPRGTGGSHGRGLPGPPRSARATGSCHFVDRMYFLPLFVTLASLSVLTPFSIFVIFGEHLVTFSHAFSVGMFNHSPRTNILSEVSLLVTLLRTEIVTRVSPSAVSLFL